MIVILGAGGHAKVLAAILKEQRQEFRYCTDDEVYQDIVVIGVGDIAARDRLYCKFDSPPWRNLLHSSAVILSAIGPYSAIQAMAGAVIQPGCCSAPNTIINTRASVDHDCIIGYNCHIAPGATLCGGVIIGDHAFVGAGATIVHGVVLPDHTFIAAGSLVVSAEDIRKPYNGRHDTKQGEPQT